MSEFTLKTLRSIYVSNDYYNYPVFSCESWRPTCRPNQEVSGTGWQVIPNILWEHFCSPKDFYEMVIKFEAVHVKGVSCKLFNMIPLQSQLAIQGTSTFTTFNNTIYMMGYKDDLYETPPYDWNDTRTKNERGSQGKNFNPVFKEGVTFTRTAQEPVFSEQSSWWKYPLGTKERENLATNKLRQYLPEYVWAPGFGQGDKCFTAEPTSGATTGAFWDPLNRPGSIQELRPGKNAIGFSWNTHECDSKIWFNLDYPALLWPYNRDYVYDDPLYKRMVNKGLNNLWPPGDVNPANRGDSYAYGIHPDARTRENRPNWRKLPIVPTRWFFEEMKASNINVHNIWSAACEAGGNTQWVQRQWNVDQPGTEYEQYKYPPTQWFVKMIPLWDDQNQLIRLEAQMWMELSIHLIGKPRRSAIYAPTWGPMPNDLYETNPNVPFNLSDIRGRSAGARRTWLSFRQGPEMLGVIPNTTVEATTGTPWTAASYVSPQDEMFPTASKVTHGVSRRFRDTLAKFKSDTKVTYSLLSDMDDEEEGEGSDDFDKCEDRD